jgi:hypothetical protein
MNGISAMALGAFVLMVAAVASGRARGSEVPGTSQATPAQSVPAGNKSGAPQLTPLFTIGGVVGVYLWAPVEPTYDASTNRNLAANPLLESSGPTTR